MRVEANRGKPVRDESGILTGGHAAVVITPATEQKFTRFLARGFDVIVDRLPRLLRQLESDGPTGLLLPHCRAIDRIDVGYNDSHGHSACRPVASGCLRENGPTKLAANY